MVSCIGIGQYHASMVQRLHGWLVKNTRCRAARGNLRGRFHLHDSLHRGSSVATQKGSLYSYMDSGIIWVYDYIRISAWQRRFEIKSK